MRAAGTALRRPTPNFPRTGDRTVGDFYPKKRVCVLIARSQPQPLRGKQDSVAAASAGGRGSLQAPGKEFSAGLRSLRAKAEGVRLTCPELPFRLPGGPRAGRRTGGESLGLQRWAEPPAV